METPETDTQYFLEMDGQKSGPFQLSELVDAGMEAESLVWWQGLESWARAGKIPKFAALIEADRRERRAARRADRLPEASGLRRLGRANLLAILPTAALCFIGSTTLLTSLVLWAIAKSSDGPPPARPSEGLVLTATVFLVVGLAGTLFGMAFFILQAMLTIALVRQCRAVVRAAAPSERTERKWLGSDLLSLPQLLSGMFGFGGVHVELPEGMGLTALSVLSMKGGALALFALAGLALLTLFIMVAPLLVCLMKPELALPVVGVVVLLVIYAAAHLPIVIGLLGTIYRTGFALNQVIDLYRLYQVKIPWAPIGLGFATAICGMLLNAGPFSLAFFILLAIWVRKTSVTAAMICDPESRECIAVPLPKEPAAKPAADIVV